MYIIIKSSFFYRFNHVTQMTENKVLTWHLNYQFATWTKRMAISGVLLFLVWGVCVSVCMGGWGGGVTDLVAFVGFDIDWALDFFSLLYCQVQLVKVKHSLFPVGVGGLRGWKKTNRVHYNNTWIQLASLNFFKVVFGVAKNFTFLQWTTYL